MKVVISIVPIVLINGYSALNYYYPALFSGINKFFLSSTGIMSKNVYMMVLTFAIGSIVFNGITYLMLRKATVKNN